MRDSEGVERGEREGAGGSEVVVESAGVTGGVERAKLEVRAGLAGGPGRAAPSEREGRLVTLVMEVLEVLNRGGDLGERILEARSILSEGVREIANWRLEIEN